MNTGLSPTAPASPPLWASRPATVLLVALVVIRVFAAIWAAAWNIRGDYYASMPGAYVRTVNPTLWNSPDMAGAWGYQRDTYFHGPVQYLTLYYAALLDSYEQIAALLLPVYAVVLGLAFWCSRRATALLSAAPLTAPLLASTFLFFPLLQAYIQREFEVIVLLALCAALWLLLTDHRRTAAVALAYVAWYKYAAVVFVGYLGLRRWTSAVVSFVLTSVVILLAAQAVFGLHLFFNNNVPSHAAQVLNVFANEFRTDAAGHLYGVGFCTGWFDNETTLANVRHGLCTVSARVRWLPPHLPYLVICALIAAIYLWAHWRLEQRRPGLDQPERWRRALELSIVITAYTCFVFSHYYYLIVLVIPLNVLLVRFLDRGDRWRLLLWAVSYVLISAFLIPTSVLTRLSGIDVWAFFINGAWFLLGELLLTGLLLVEYLELSASRPIHAERPMAAQRSAV